MTDTITLNIDELLDQINQMKKDGMKYVKLLILDEEELDGDTIPKTLSLSACKNINDTLIFDYEMIEQSQ
jgi:hypothetical protein